MKEIHDSIIRMKERIRSGKTIVGAGVDSTELEQLCSRADCDMILFYPTARYKEAENRFLAGYMPFGNSNSLMLRTAREMTTVVSGHHIFLAMNGTDPFLNKELLLKRFQEVHFQSVHNYPAIGLVDGYFKTNLDQANLGIDQEVETFRYASKAGFRTCTMVRTKGQAAMMARAGADVIVYYLGLGDGSLPEEANGLALEKDIDNLNECSQALARIGNESVILFHSEHVRTMDDVKYILKNTRGIHGYLLMSIARKDYSINRLRAEIRQLREM